MDLTTTIIAIIILVVILYFAYNRFYATPLVKPTPTTLSEVAQMQKPTSVPNVQESKNNQVEDIQIQDNQPDKSMARIMPYETKDSPSIGPEANRDPQDEFYADVMQ